MKSLLKFSFVLVVAGLISGGSWAYDLGIGLHVQAIATNSGGDAFVGSKYGGLFRVEKSCTYKFLGFWNSDIQTIAVNSSDVLFIGSTVHGIYKSDNNGDNWDVSNEGFESVPNAWDFHFLDNGDILTGITGGIYRSINNGESWVMAGLDGYTVKCFTQTGSGDILAGTADNGIFRSSDNGLSWSLTDESTVPLQTGKLITGPDGTLYASTWGQGIYRSTDNGASWEQLKLETSDPRINFVTFAENGTMYTSAEDDGVFLSADNGETWERVFEDFFRVKALHIEPDGTMYSGLWGSGMLTSTDNGDSWKYMAMPLYSYVHTITENSVGDIYVGTEYGGVFRSDDKGNSYQYLGFDDSDVEVIAVNEIDDVFVGTSAEGVFRSNNRGESWTQVNSRLGTGSWVWGFAFPDNGDILAGITGGVFRSSDNGETWKPSGLSEYTVRWFTKTLNGDVLAGTRTGGIFMSNDNGKTWSLTTPETIELDTVRLVTASDGTIYASTWGQGVYRSLDNGNTWGNVSPETFDPRINFVVIDSSGDLYTSAENDGMYSSPDGGESWERIFGALPYRSKALHFTENGHVFSGHWGSGLFHSRSFGDEWNVYIDPVSVETALPEEIGLSAYPNPFNPATTITFTLNHSAKVTVTVYHITGQKAAELYNGYCEPGKYSFIWDASGLAAGTYIIAMKERDNISAHKVTLIK